jgi:PAS domain-containing protein
MTVMRARAVDALRLRRLALAPLWLAAAALERLVQLPAGFRFPGLLLLAVIVTAWMRGRVAAAVGIACATAFTWASMAAHGRADGDVGTLALFVVVATIAAALASALRNVRDERDALRAALTRGRVDGDAAQRAVGAMQDRLDAQADWHAMLLGTVDEGVVTTDAQGRVRSINATAEALTGWRADEAIGLPVARVFGIDDR